MKLRDLFSSSSRGNAHSTPARRSHNNRYAQAGAVRVKRGDGRAGAGRYPWIVLGLLLLGVGGWLTYPDWRATAPQPKESAAVPDCQLSTTEAASPNAPPITLLNIPAGRYPLPTPTSGLYPFTDFHHLEPIVVDAPFSIQAQPLSRALFKEYADYLAKSPDGEEKERLLSYLGLSWNQGEESSPAVRGISWEAAHEFGLWLSQKTGCSYDIPSREEWAATIIHLYNTGAQLPKPSDGFDSTPLKSLLRGGTEWTRSPCAMGYYLVGEEDWGGDTNNSQPICMPSLFAVAGFRLVLHPTAKISPQRENVENTNH
ncbi:MAG: SUMF1/EgtB/PvdO family nonheme iron enzyme [Magnetococcales bacterium]|nr:SUMF1/EgtB/PvdO family nonheme iron enzyme [Magnetococcales bacterium]